MARDRREYDRERNKRPERKLQHRVNVASKRYGLTKDQVLELISQQHCVICGASDPTHIDHDHVTGEVRGLLCQHCNLMLGQARDNPDILEAGAKYLRQYIR